MGEVTKAVVPLLDGRRGTLGVRSLMGADGKLGWRRVTAFAWFWVYQTRYTWKHPSLRRQRLDEPFSVHAEDVLHVPAGGVGHLPISEALHGAAATKPSNLEGAGSANTACNGGESGRGALQLK